VGFLDLFRAEQPDKNIVEVSSEDYAKVEEDPDVVLLYFTHPECGFCRMVKPTLERLTSEIKVFKVDASKEPEIAARYGVRGWPTILALYQGEIVDYVQGAEKEKVIREMFTNARAKVSAGE
jgi:thioredoxin-like negative regulator of GroEL